MSFPVGTDAHERSSRRRALYAPNLIWLAPSRRIHWEDPEFVIRQLLREAGGMHGPEFTPLRRHQSEQQIIDEFAVRFIYSGEGIENAPKGSGDFVEL